MNSLHNKPSLPHSTKSFSIEYISLAVCEAQGRQGREAESWGGSKDGKKSLSTKKLNFPTQRDSFPIADTVFPLISIHSKPWLAHSIAPFPYWKQPLSLLKP
jgi:hypothetical protein